MRQSLKSRGKSLAGRGEKGADHQEEYRSTKKLYRLVEDRDGSPRDKRLKREKTRRRAIPERGSSPPADD